MNCPECNINMEQIDTTYSNVETNRCKKDQHTGDIYRCQKCSELYIDNILSGKLEPWSY